MLEKDISNLWRMRIYVWQRVMGASGAFEDSSTRREKDEVVKYRCKDCQSIYWVTDWSQSEFFGAFWRCFTTREV